MKFYNKSSFKRINRKNLIISICIIILILLLIISFSLYIANQNIRDFFDVYLFKKNISSSNSNKIDFNDDESTFVFAYDKYVAVLNKNTFSAYNSSGNKAFNLTTELNNPISSSANRFIALAEKDGQKVYLISGQNIIWQKDIEGNISKISVNKNGYVSLIASSTSYKSIVITYDSTGKELFKTYLSSTLAIDSAISNDNKYVAYAEIDTSGTLIKSSVKVISIEKALSNSAESTVYTKDAENSKMIIKIQYQEKGELVCVYDDSINIVKDGQEQELIKKDDETTFISGNLGNSIAYIKEEQRGVFDSSSTLNIVNSSNNQTYKYNFDEIAKEMYTNGNVIGINIGTEIYFVSTNGMLIKKYTSNQEITNVMITNNIAIIIYKDRIEIINL